MKIKSIIAATFVILGFTMTSCEYDNYDAPSYVFSGQLKCDGENFPFDSNRGLLRVFQKGYGKVDGGGYEGDGNDESEFDEPDGHY